MKNNKTIIITGTHHTPATELIRLLKSDPQTNWTIHYFGHQYKTESHILHTLIPKLKVIFTNIECGKFDRKNLDKTIFGIPKTISAFFKSYGLIKKISPHIIVSFGGYVSVPVIMAAFFQKIPSITHEQTLTNSLATKINSLFVTKVALSFDLKSQKQELPIKKIVVTGNLIRREIYNQVAKNITGIKNPFIYFTGGNQGSMFINQLVYKLVPLLKSKFSIIHQTGTNTDPVIQKQLQISTPQYFPLDFVEIEDIGWVLGQCSLVVSRSGANICQEINALQLKSILIPHPATQQNEQYKNATWLKSMQPLSTVIVKQDQATPQKIYHQILSLHKKFITAQKSAASTQHPLFNLIHEISR